MSRQIVWKKRCFLAIILIMTVTRTVYTFNNIYNKLLPAAFPIYKELLYISRDSGDRNNYAIS